MPSLRRLLLSALLVVAGAPLLPAQTVWSAGGTTITNTPASGPRSVINADRASDSPPFSHPFFNRWYLPLVTTVTATTTGAVDLAVGARFRLVDSTGAVVPCENALTGGYVAGTSTNFNVSQAGTYSFTRGANLVPTVQLKVSEVYRLEVIVAAGRSASVATAATANSFQFAHFVGPNGPDANYNVLARLESNVGYQRTFLVATDPTRSDFVINAGYSAYRFDEPQAFQASDLIQLLFTVELFDTAAPATPIPLETSVISVPVSLATFVPVFLQNPSVASGTATLNFRPAAGVQLDAPGKTYFAKVSIAHLERQGSLNPPALPLIVPENAATLSAVRLLQFNGNLIFGPASAHPIVTTLASVTNNPAASAVVVAGPPARLDTLLSVASAFVNGTAHTYTASPASVSLLANGDALIRGASTVTLVPPSTPDRDTVAGVRFDRGSIVLDVNGGTTSLNTILPAGMGWAATAASKVLNGKFAFSSVILNQQLEPALANLSWSPPGGTGYVMEESKPIFLRATSVVWAVAAGRFNINATAGTAAYVRSTELTQLEASPLPAALGFKRSNEQYWRWAQNISGATYVQSGVAGGAEFTGNYRVTNTLAQTFRPHFPWGAAMVPDFGQLAIAADAVVTTGSNVTLSAGAPTVSLPWLNGCLDPACDPSLPGSTAQSFTPDNGRLNFTPDGGFVASGVFVSGLDLKWGFIPALGAYAHRVVTPFAQGTFAMSGVFLRGADLTTGNLADAPGVLLLTGVDAATAAIAERPATAAYQNGRAEYPGYNVRLGPDDASASGLTGRSTLAGANYGNYPLKNRSKYYVRAGGVTGVHDQVAGPAITAALYGYQFTLTNFGLSFLDNGVRDSRTNGRVQVPVPSDIFVDFAELKFFCNGGLDKAQIASSTPPQTLSYWQAPIDIQAMLFLQPDSCAVSEGYLTLGLLSYSSHLKDALAGTVGFLSNGNLINKQFADTKGGGLAGLDSRFKVPKQVKFQGPKRQTTQGGYEDYVFTPSVDAYLNVTGTPPLWTHNTAEGLSGFWNFGRRLKVAFFEAPRIHFQTSANRPPANGAITNWQTSPINIANGAWATATPLVQTSFFDAAVYHDTWNRGLPYPVTFGGTGESLSTYTTSPNYMTRTRQGWLGGAVELKYKLKWSSPTRSFSSLEASESQDDSAAGELAKQFVVVKVDSRLPYLSAERAQLTFGASYSGLPKISLANIVVNELDDLTGVFKAATNAACDSIFLEVDKGLDSLGKVLGDQLRDHLTATLDPIVSSTSGALYGQLHTLWVNGQYNQATVTNAVNAQLGAAGPLRIGMQQSLQIISNTTAQIQQIVKTIDDVDAALYAIHHDFLGVDPVSGEIPVARNLVRELIKVLSMKIGGSLGSLLGSVNVNAKLDELTAPLFKGAQPTLLELHDVLVQLQAVVAQLKIAAQTGGDLAAELNAVVTAQAAELDALIAGARTDALALLNGFAVGVPGKNFLAVTEAQIRTKIEQAIYDRFFGTQLVAKIQVALKQRFQDVEGAIRSGIDSVFAEVNRIIKKSISGLLAEVDESLNDVLGEFGKYLGSGSIEGYAIFNGDALRKVRVDGRFQFKVPDPLNIEAFLEINQYTSKDTPPGCNQALGTDTLTEVLIGTTNAPCDFLSPGVRMNLAVKFSFTQQGNGQGSIHPVGLGGALEMSKGPINFQAFKITKLAVAVAFGKTENYLSAALAMQIGDGFGANGGVFFGRTCSIAPIALWDPFAAKVIGSPSPGSTFSGIYVYGQVHIPVSEVLLGIPATCFFQINADAGVGFFYFTEGPTFGARMHLGVDGEVACLLGISGQIDLIGGKINGKITVAGKGEFCATIAFIDVCKDVSLSTTVQTDGTLKGSGGAK